jgi:hypothetical protein
MNRRQNIDSILYAEEGADTFPTEDDCYCASDFGDDWEDPLGSVDSALAGRDYTWALSGVGVVGPLMHKASVTVGDFLTPRQIAVANLNYLVKDKIYVVTDVGEHRANHGIMVEVSELPCLEKIGWCYLDNFISV